MRVLVTGGAGFVGSALVDRLLAEDHDVDVVDDLSTGSLANLADARSGRSRRFTFHRIDMRYPGITELVAHRKPEVVYHLAAHTDTRESLARPVADAEVNIIGSLHLLQGAIAANASKVIFTSSADVYGPPDDLPVREGHPQRPQSPAAVAKKTVADYLHAYREVHGLEYTALILADVYGPRQSPEIGRVPLMAAQMLARQRVTLFGEGEQTRDLVFVDDAVDALVRALDKAGGLTVNIGSGVETSERELYAILARITNTEGEPRLAPSPVGDVSRWTLDPGRAGLHLGWQPWTALDDGVARTVAWLREELRAARPTR